MSKESEIKQYLKQAANNLPAIDQAAAYSLQMRFPLTAVLKAYKKYLIRNPSSLNAAFNYAYYLSKDGQFEAAIDQYKRCIKRGIDKPEEVHLNIANLFMDHLHDAIQAKYQLEQALEKNPRYASAYYNLGNLSEQEGDRPEAIRSFEQCLKFDPGNESALARLVDAHSALEKDDPLLARLIQIAVKSNNSDVHFVLGSAFEKLTEFELAWQHFSRGNTLDRAVFPNYRPDVTEHVFNGIISQCDAQWLSRLGGDSDESVFICGMFRTGSTLLEQVLAAHPVFTAGGERQFFPRLVSREFGDFPVGLDQVSSEKTLLWRRQHGDQLRDLFGDDLRLTDKRPDNFLHIGLIKAVLPSAKFIVTERDWRDVATSVYGTRLGPAQNYSTSLKDIHHYIALQKNLIDHWAALLGPDLMRVQYEDMVKKPRETIGGLLNGLGADWNESCLGFNTLTNPVQTASVWQVRQPLHTKSVGRWRNYQQHFENEFGDKLSG